ncbi:MAG TPA: hypothetical protein VFQ67_17175 [Allosphingosinicella sp.]|jgi:hypothetical protein|nr:hypothetical protein [Allosphingosinicella sp.]
MAPGLKPELPDDDDELFIHLDLDGLAALLRAVEAALATGRGHVTSESAGGKGVAVRSGSSHDFERITVTFARPRSTGLQ